MEKITTMVLNFYISTNIAVSLLSSLAAFRTVRHGFWFIRRDGDLGPWSDHSTCWLVFGKSFSNWFPKPHSNKVWSGTQQKNESTSGNCYQLSGSELVRFGSASLPAWPRTATRAVLKLWDWRMAPSPSDPKWTDLCHPTGSATLTHSHREHGHLQQVIEDHKTTHHADSLLARWYRATRVCPCWSGFV